MVLFGLSLPITAQGKRRVAVSLVSERWLGRVPVEFDLLVELDCMTILESQNRRLVSGQRVVCSCTLELPKTNPFSAYKAVREGVIVLNVRGGSLYLADQFTDTSIVKVFPPDHSSTIKNIKLYAATGPVVDLGNVEVRYLKLNRRTRMTGIVVKFVNLSDAQMDKLNALGELFPEAGADEEASIPLESVYRRAS